MPWTECKPMDERLRLIRLSLAESVRRLGDSSLDVLAIDRLSRLAVRTPDTHFVM